MVKGFVVIVIGAKMDTATHVQFRDEALYLSLCTNVLRKSLKLFLRKIWINNRQMSAL